MTNRMKLWVVLLAVTGMTWLAARAQGQQGPAAGASEKRAVTPAAGIEFEKYYLVLLRRGPSWTPEVTPEVQKIQEEHLRHLRKMAESGKLLIAGPFGDQQDETLRGMCLYRVASIEEARSLAEADPAVKAGRLKVETLTWYVEKGYVTFPKARL